LRKSCQKLQSPQEQADSYLSLANTQQTLAAGEEVRRKRNQYDRKALTAYQQAIDLSSSSTTKEQAQLNQLSLFLKLKKWSKAESLWRSLVSQIDNLPPSHTGVYQQINFAKSLVKLASQENFTANNNFQLPTFAEIDRILAKATEQAKILGDKRAQAYAFSDRGNLYEIQSPDRNLDKAETFTKNAISLASTFEASDISSQLFWQLGRINKAQEKIEPAIASYTKAFDTLQSLRSDLVAINPELQFSFRDSVEPVDRQLVELNLDYASSLNKATDKQTEEKKGKLLTQARNVIESLQAAELNNFFREVCIDAKPIAIDTIDRSAAVIYPIILDARLQVLLSLPDRSPQLYTTEVKRAVLENTIDEIQRSLIDARSIPEGFFPQYQQMYDWIVRPLETELVNNKVKTLAFVLDGKLRNIPMSVLRDRDGYLVEKYAIALTPGLQLLNPKPLTEVQLRVLTAGLSKSRDGFAELPNVPNELGQIQELKLSPQPLLDERFTTGELQKEVTASGVPAVHLATHAQFSSKAEDTFILAWDKRINIKQLDSLLRGNAGDRRGAIELFVLSACETAIGDDRAALGLAGVAVRAGARSTLATLWRVSDASTPQIMTNFYTQLGQSKDTRKNKAEALRQAQLTLIKDKKFNSPHFWAPFVLIGNWI
jgi:CHAT domain-containing protein